MPDPLNITTMPIADKMQRHMMSSYYLMLLDALQAEAKRHGYFFAHTAASMSPASLPPILADCLARAVDYRRRCYLFPNCQKDWERMVDDSMSDGYAQGLCRSMLDALAALGIYLQEGPEAGALLAEEELRQREKVSLPPEPFDPVSAFERLNVSKQDIPGGHSDMGTTPKIDFEPGLFGEGEPPVARPVAPPVEPIKPFLLIVVLVTACFIALAAVLFFLLPGSLKEGLHGEAPAKTAHWEEYRNLPGQESRNVVEGAIKEGADCHELRTEKITVCRWP